MLSNHRNYRSSYGRLFEQVRHLEFTKTTKQMLFSEIVCVDMSLFTPFCTLRAVIGM
jgi:hypothetical protein